MFLWNPEVKIFIDEISKGMGERRAGGAGRREEARGEVGEGKRES